MAHDVDFTRSSFGGGWLTIAEGKSGGDVPFIVESVMGEPDAPIAPLGGKMGWIVEPQDLQSVADALASNGLHVEEIA